MNMVDVTNSTVTELRFTQILHITFEYLHILNAGVWINNFYILCHGEWSIGLLWRSMSVDGRYVC